MDKPTLDAADREYAKRWAVGITDAESDALAHAHAAGRAAQAARIATLEAELAEAQQAATFGTPLVVDAYKADRDAALAHAAMLRDALREFTPGGVPHNGVACALREFAAERQRASGKWDGRSETLVQWAIAIEAALASTPAADLAAHDVEVLERAAKDFEASDDELTRLRASLAAAEAKLAEERAEHAATRSIAEQHAHRLSVDLADERARYEALVGAVDPGPCPCCGDDIHSGHSLDCTFADDCPEEARAWDRVHEAIAADLLAAHAARRAAEKEAERD